jgi:hypothetical protein
MQSTAIPQLGLFHLDRPNARLNRPNRIIPMSNHALSAVGQVSGSSISSF